MLKGIAIILVLLSMFAGIMYLAISTAHDHGYRKGIRECETVIEETITDSNAAFRFSDGRVALVYRQWPKKQKLYKAMSFYEP